jgi:hypothetical protein
MKLFFGGLGLYTIISTRMNCLPLFSVLRSLYLVSTETCAVHTCAVEPPKGAPVDPGRVIGVPALIDGVLRPRCISSRREIPSCLWSEFFGGIGLLSTSSNPYGCGGGQTVKQSELSKLAGTVTGDSDDGRLAGGLASLEIIFEICPKRKRQHLPNSKT